MCDVVDELPPQRFLTLQLGGHGIEAVAELGDFIRAACRDPSRQLTVREVARRAAQLGDRPDHAARQHPRQTDDDEGDETRDDHQPPIDRAEEYRFRIAAARRNRHDVDERRRAVGPSDPGGPPAQDFEGHLLGRPFVHPLEVDVQRVLGEPCAHAAEPRRARSAGTDQVSLRVEHQQDVIAGQIRGGTRDRRGLTAASVEHRSQLRRQLIDPCRRGPTLDVLQALELQARALTRAERDGGNRRDRQHADGQEQTSSQTARHLPFDFSFSFC